ncbi:MAG: response regulator [Euryarchaeota archaeon]|nr:response regulator [Euryarchaeota archaeon]
MIHVLHVDDDDLFLELTRAFLEDYGDLQVDIANSGSTALNMMLDRHYDAIISDYSMPYMDGLDLLKRVRKRNTEIPFILFTGREREEVVIEACNAGATFYLRKGVDVKEQFFELHHVIGQSVAKFRAEEYVKMTKQHDRMTMDLAKIAKWELDISLGILRFDDIFYELYGTDAKREGGYLWTGEDYFREFVHPDDMDKVIQFTASGHEKIPGDSYLQIEHRIIRRDGEVRHLLVRVSKMMDKNGNAVKLTGISMDITDAKN